MLKGEYGTIREAGAEVVAVSADSLEFHLRSDRGQVLGGCPFPLPDGIGVEAARLYGVVGEEGRRSPDAASGLHQIPWFQPRSHGGQFLEMFQALGAIQGIG